MAAVSCHLCACAFVPSYSTCWFNASPVLDILEFFRPYSFQEKWASGVVNMLLEGITPFACGGNRYREEPRGPSAWTARLSGSVPDPRFCAPAWRQVSLFRT